MKRNETKVKGRERLENGFYWGAASIALWLVATNMGMPYTQDKRNALGCDSMCQGSMNSARSTLSLVGAALMGRLSDASWLEAYGGGRRVCLCLGIVATAVSLVLTSQADTLDQLWSSLAPQILQQNMNITKALFSDYHTHLDSSSAQRASTAGLLGMVGGLAMMLGPLLGSSLLSDMHQATQLSLLTLVMAGVCICFTPSTPQSNRPSTKRELKPDNGNNTNNNGHSNTMANLWSILDVPSARSPPALFLLTCRLLNTLSYHIFSTISAPSLRHRFDFGPAEYGRFFSFIGFCFVLSQYVGQFLLKRTCGDGNDSERETKSTSSSSSRRKQIFVVALVIIGLGRYLAFTTHHVWAMYGYYAVTVLATGVVSTIFSTDTSQVAAPGEAGAFFGVVAAIESGAGMVGPLVGGSLAQLQSVSLTGGGSGGSSLSSSSALWAPPPPPLLASIFLTTFAGAMVWWGYESIVLRSICETETSAADKKTN